MLDHFTVIGVVSHIITEDCSSKDFPVKYVDVYKYLGWIKDKADQIGLFEVMLTFIIVVVDNS